MKYYSIRDFRADTKGVCEEVHEYGEAIVTNNGKPTLLLVDVAGEDLEELIASFHQARAMRVLNRVRQTAEENGYMTEAEINAIVKTYRREKREKEKKATPASKRGEE